VEHIVQYFKKNCPNILFNAEQSRHAATQMPEKLEALLTYLAPIDTKPFTHIYEPGAGKQRRLGSDVAHGVTIRNARLAANDFSLDNEGFELIAFPTRVTDFYDGDQVRLIYYTEVIDRLKALMGATKIVISNYTRRSTAGPLRGNVRAEPPVIRVHSDYTNNSAPQRVRELLPDEAEQLLLHRFAAINIWRPMHGPVKRSPLALCDARSVRSHDLVPTDLILRRRMSETYKVTYNASHQWYYFPDMQQDEAVLIKCYDSDQNRARFTPHAAFSDPTAPPDSPPRESIEVRAFAFF
jgi:hypothetical protein